MTLPLTDSALIGTCLAASALAVLVLTSGGNGNGTPEHEPENAAETAAITPAVASDMPESDPDFGDQVRAYLMEHPEGIFEAVAVYEERSMAAQDDMSRELIAANAEALFEDGVSWVGGNPEGDITLVEFVDYRCGFCQRAHGEGFAFLDADPDVRLVIKEFPILGPESEVASRFAIAVLALGGDDAYASVHDALLEHQGPVTEFYLEDLAVEMGLDFDAIEEEMQSEATTAVIVENRALAQRLQITGTPTFVMEDEMIRGFVEADVLIETAAALRD